MDFGLSDFGHLMVSPLKLIIWPIDAFCVILANIFVLAFMQKLTFIHTFIHIYMHNTEAWSPECSRRRPEWGQMLRLHRQTTGPVMTGVELAQASRRLRCSRSIVCMRQTTGPVMTGVELAKASSWLRYSQGSVCMRQTTGPVMTGVELAQASSGLCYSRSIVCMRQTIGPVNDWSCTCKGKYLAPL
jgi:hypothetical protein